jgi:hypothetical protein
LRQSRRCGIIIFGKGATAEGTEISPKVRTHLPPVQHATRKNDHGDEEEEGQEENEVNDAKREPRTGAAPSSSDFARRPCGASRNGWTEVRPFPFWGTFCRSMIFSENRF